MMSKYLVGLIAALTFVAIVSSMGQAAPIGPMSEAPASFETMVVPVQNCGNVRAFCRGRFGAGNPAFRQCVRNRGCRPPQRLTYCQRMYRQCARNFVPNRPPFRRCMARNGC